MTSKPKTASRSGFTTATSNGLCIHRTQRTHRIPARAALPLVVLRTLAPASVFLLFTTMAACTSGSGDASGTGGAGSGGHATGGSSMASGGAQAGSGGNGSGGTTASGGTLGSGGSATGGVTATGGKATGGTGSGGLTDSTGGALATGGRTAGLGGSGSGGLAGQGGSGLDASQDGGGSLGGRDGGGTGGLLGTGGVRQDSGAGGSTGTGGGTGTAFNPCAAGTACKIMPLGDSITEGYGASGNVGGYRIELFRQAVKASKDITFVGSLTNGPATVENKTFPKNHEGHGGWTISQIAGIADSTLSSNKPNIVLLKIGTNDVNGTGATGAPTGLKNLIDQITKDVPSALLVVSSIIPIKDDNQNQKVKTYNATIPTTVSAAAAAGKHVVFVDSYAAFVANTSWKTAIMGDNLHPNDAGYAVLGQTWYGAISALLP